MVLYPIDTVKVRLQTVQGRQLSRRVFVDPYAGVLAPLVVGVPAAALFFGVKDGLGELAAERGLTDPFLVEAVTVCLANAPYWLARAPIELIKTRQQLANNTMEKPWAVAQSIVDNEGLAGLWTGFQESYWHAVPADVLKFSVYRTLKERYGGAGIFRKLCWGPARPRSHCPRRHLWTWPRRGAWSAAPPAKISSSASVLSWIRRGRGPVRGIGSARRARGRVRGRLAVRLLRGGEAAVWMSRLS